MTRIALGAFVFGHWAQPRNVSIDHNYRDNASNAALPWLLHACLAAAAPGEFFGKQA